MGRSGGGGRKQKGKKNKKNGHDGNNNNNDDHMMWVDPARVRFQHSRIRPYFSGCGRSIQETLDSIRRGEIAASDLPPIQVIVGPTDEATGEPWYFSLNNRRLWVLKRCREEGLLLKSTTHHPNQVQVRVRPPKSSAEAERYSLENCALEAKVMKEAEKPPTSNANGKKSKQPQHQENHDDQQQGESKPQAPQPTEASSSSEEDDSDSDADGEDIIVSKNPFSALM